MYARFCTFHIFIIRIYIYILTFLSNSPRKQHQKEEEEKKNEPLKSDRTAQKSRTSKISNQPTSFHRNETYFFFFFFSLPAKLEFIRHVRPVSLSSPMDRKSRSSLELIEARRSI